MVGTGLRFALAAPSGTPSTLLMVGTGLRFALAAPSGTPSTERNHS